MRATLLILLLALSVAESSAQSATDATARQLESLRGNHALLYAFLRELPKGADLHSHLSGAVYAETFIGWAAEAGACIRLADLAAAPAPCDSISQPAANALRDQDLYDRIVDAWSMRNWSPALESGHDRFFGTFGKFGFANRGRTADMLAEVMRRAHANRVSYLELMNTPSDGAAQLGARVGWDADLERLRGRLRLSGLAAVLDAARRDISTTMARQRELMGCGAVSAEPACDVEVRFLYQVGRGRAPEMVFAQLLTAFELAGRDTMVVGLNMVQPEDGYVAMRDFPLHMRMLDYLHAQYPDVKVTLHAGELTPGLVPPEGLRFHIRASIEQGHARRIGHGVDIMYEDRPLELLRLMAERDVAVEINLTSNAVILGVSGTEHPLKTYQLFGVPTLLSTDDEGVSRSEMTLEYKRAVLDQNLDYATLKQMARNSLRYAFLQPQHKERLQRKLEEDFKAFESKWRFFSPQNDTESQ